MRNLSARQIKLAKHIKALRDFCFEEQLAVVEDQSDLIAIIGSRGCAKSTSVGVKMIEVGLCRPGSRCLYAAWALSDAKAIFWEPVLLFLLDVAGLKEHQDYEIKDGSTCIRFKNDSEIRLIGLDSNQTQGRKLRGQTRRIFAIDEAQSIIHADVHDIVFNDVKPRMEVGGSIILLGTATNLRRYFWRVTRDEVAERETGWSVHRWLGSQNPGYDWDAKIAEEKRKDPNYLSNPRFLQEYYATWHFDPNLLCYPGFSIEKNVISSLPPGTGRRHVMGCDFGYNDAFAAIVGAIDEKGDFYIVDAYKETKMSSDKVVSVIANLMNKWKIGPGDAVGDSAGGLPFMATLNARYGLSMIGTGAKGDKAEFMGMLNADFGIGKVKVITSAPNDHPLLQELISMSWSQREKESTDHPKLIVPAGVQDHCADALLYAWRKYVCNVPKFASFNGTSTHDGAKVQPRRSTSNAGDDFFAQQNVIDGPSWRGVR